jgi:hypothetical protein
VNGDLNRHAGWKDWELKRIILELDWCSSRATVTASVGLRYAPGTKGKYAGVPLHAGIIA